MFYHDNDLRSTSELCVRCGLCCVVLRASCTEEEARRVCPDNPLQFAEPDETMEDGKWLMRFPCMYLKGRVLGAVFCSIYDKERPSVCGSYLCRIAMLYSQGQIELEPALKQLKVAFWTSDVTVFNWAGFEGEQAIMRRQAVCRIAGQLRKEGASQPGVDLYLADQLTPGYWPSTPLEHGLFSMHFMSFDHREKLGGEAKAKADREALGLYYELDELEEMSERDKEVAQMTVRQVLAQLRLYLADNTEVDHAQDSVERSRSAEADWPETEHRVPTPALEDRSSGGESEGASLRAAPGDQDDRPTSAGER